MPSPAGLGTGVCSPSRWALPVWGADTHPGSTQSHHRDGGHTTNPLEQGTKAGMECGEVTPLLLGNLSHF